MGASLEQLAALAEPTPEEEIKQRPAPGSRNKTLDYVDARFVMDRLDSAVGPAFWRDEYHESKNADGVVCRLSILVGEGEDAEWVWKEDVGTESNIEATKGGYSDAFKRAAVKWGIARDLYDAREGHSSHAPRVTKGSTTQQRAVSGKPKYRVIDPEDAPWMCPDHEGVVVWPAGKTSEGRSYDAFYACPEGKKCDKRAPRGLKVKPEHLPNDMDSLPF